MGVVVEVEAGEGAEGEGAGRVSLVRLALLRDADGEWCEASLGDSIPSSSFFLGSCSRITHDTKG